MSVQGVGDGLGARRVGPGTDTGLCGGLVRARLQRDSRVERRPVTGTTDPDRPQLQVRSRVRSAPATGLPVIAVGLIHRVRTGRSDSRDGRRESHRAGAGHSLQPSLALARGRAFRRTGHRATAVPPFAAGAVSQSLFVEPHRAGTRVARLVQCLAHTAGHVSFRQEAGISVAMSRSVMKGCLRAVPLFAYLGDSELESLLSSARAVRFPRGFRIFEEGAAADCCFVLTSGRVRVVLSGANGAEILLHIVTPTRLVGNRTARQVDALGIGGGRRRLSHDQDSCVGAGCVCDETRSSSSASSPPSSRRCARPLTIGYA